MMQKQPAALMASGIEHEKLMTPGEVSALFRVDPATVSKWARAGKLGSIRTPGGHRRFREADVRALLAGDPPPQPDPLDAAAGPLPAVLAGMQPGEGLADSADWAPRPSEWSLDGDTGCSPAATGSLLQQCDRLGDTPVAAR